jgi:hypothetical protein
VGRKFVIERLRPLRNLSPAKRIQIANSVQSSLLEPRNSHNFELEKMLDGVGMLCLTESWNEPLFWGHYALKHQGICIEYRTDRDVFALANRIEYQDELPIIVRPNDSHDEVMRKTFFTKPAAWRNEKEWRIVKARWPEEKIRSERATLGYLGETRSRILTEQRGHGIYQFDPTAIASVTMGMMIKPKDRATVVACVKAAPVKVQVFEAARHKTRYEIVRSLVQL